MLTEALINYGLDWSKISKEVFQGKKAEVEIELRACVLLGVKDSKNVG